MNKTEFEKALRAIGVVRAGSNDDPLRWSVSDLAKDLAYFLEDCETDESVDDSMLKKKNDKLSIESLLNRITSLENDNIANKTPLNIQERVTSLECDMRTIKNMLSQISVEIKDLSESLC